MKPVTRKIILAISATVLLLLIVLAGTLFYFYRHPASVKPFLESTVSRTAGASFTVEKLAYSLKPLQIRAEGVRLAPGKDLKGVSLAIPSFIADMELEGPFNGKRLIFKVLKVNGFSLEVSQDLSLPQLKPGKQDTSWIAGAIGRLFAFLVFRDVEFQAAEISGGHISGRLADQSFEVDEIRANLTPERLIEITCNARFDSGSMDIHLNAPQVRITTDQALSLVDPEIKARIAATGIAVRSPTLDISAADYEADLAFRRDQARLSFAPLELVLKGAVLKKIAPEPLPPLNLNLKSEGSLYLKDLEARISSFHLTLGDILDTTGHLRVNLREKPGAALDLTICRLVPERLRPFLPSEFRKALASGGLSGPVSLKGQVTAAISEGRLDLNADIRTRLDRNPFSYTKDEMNLTGEVSADIHVTGGLPDLKALGKVEATRTLFSAKGIKTGPLTASLDLTYAKSLIGIKDLEVLIPQASFQMGEKEAALRDIRLRAPKGTFDPGKGDLDLPKATLDTSLLKNLKISFRTEKAQKSATVLGKNIHLIETAGALGLIPPGWQFNGADALEARAVQEPSGDWAIKTKMDFQNLTLENRDATCMGEGISVNVRVDGKVNQDLSRLNASTSLGVEAGEILFDRFYFNLHKNGLSADAEGACDFSRKTLRLPHLKVALKNLLSFSLEGTLAQTPRGPRTRMTLNIPATPAKPVFRQFLMEPFKMEKPLLSTLDVGGVLSADLDLELNGVRQTAKGYLQWQEGQLASVDQGFSIHDIDLRFPVWQVSGTSEPAGAPLKGALTIGSVGLPILPPQPLDLKLQVGPNSLFIEDPTVIRVPGGKIEIGFLSCRGLYGSEPSVETSLAFESLDLDPLLSQVWARPTGGFVSGKLVPIRFSKGRLKTEGLVRADVFGGKVTLSDLGASGILTSAPVFRLNAEWKDLHLDDLTRDTSFGKVEGILEGYVKDLQIAYGQPQRFELLTETVETKGVSQKISVKAVDNIARIGGGQSPFMGAAGVLSSFFKKFPYKKIGVKASLENDVFRINGTIKDGDKEYLIKKSGFSGVDVVNQNPDNRTSFKDMVKRIKRVTSSKGGPVIK